MLQKVYIYLKKIIKEKQNKFNKKKKKLQTENFKIKKSLQQTQHNSNSKTTVYLLLPLNCNK